MNNQEFNHASGLVKALRKKATGLREQAEQAANDLEQAMALRTYGLI